MRKELEKENEEGREERRVLIEKIVWWERAIKEKEKEVER